MRTPASSRKLRKAFAERMYTLIRGLQGGVILRTHVDPAYLSPEKARRLLRALQPLLATLEAVAGSQPSGLDGPEPATAVPVPHGLAPAANGVGSSP